MILVRNKGIVLEKKNVTKDLPGSNTVSISLGQIMRWLEGMCVISYPFQQNVLAPMTKGLGVFAVKELS